MTCKHKRGDWIEECGGAWGPKGRANNDWRIAFAGLDATLAKIKGADHE